MKVAFFVIAAVAATLASPTEEERTFYPRMIKFPDGDGVLRTVDLEATPDLEVLDELTKKPDSTRFLLYTRENPEKPQELFNDKDSIRKSNFDGRKQTIFIAHGWLSRSSSEPNPTVRAAYLAKHDCNVITIDWHRLANTDYVTAVRGVPAVGRRVGEFINYLVSKDLTSYNRIHLVGFSLGAHLVGNAGRATGGKVARVTGLDPAGPLWNTNKNRLSSGDADYVEAIHTDGGYTVGGLGIGSPIVDVDFFPNGGISQPGCITSVCNHNYAWELFAASVTYNHLLGFRCSNNLQLTLDRCRGDILPMGNDDLKKTGKPGFYRVNTNRRYPY